MLKCTLLEPTIQIDIIDAKAMQRTVFNLLFSIQSIDVFVIVSAVVLSIWLIIWIFVLHKIAHFDSEPRFLRMVIIICMHCHKMLKTEETEETEELLSTFVLSSVLIHFPVLFSKLIEIPLSLKLWVYLCDASSLLVVVVWLPLHFIVALEEELNLIHTFLAFIFR